MKPEKNYLVTQSNKLVEARYSLTIYEQRILLMMISLIESDDEDFKTYRIKISDFIDLVGLKGGSAYTRIKSILREFRKREVFIEKENSKSFLVTGWISSAQYIDEKGEISLAFDPNLKPYLLNVKEKFLKLRLHRLISFKSNYTTRIYTLLKQYQKFGERTFDIAELKEILGLDEGKYSVYADFKKNVIITAQKELDKKNDSGEYISDIGFDFEQIRTGRKITSVKFLIKKQSESDVIEKIDESISVSEQYLLDYGVTKDKARELADDFSKKEIERCIILYEKKKKSNKVSSGVGLLIHLIESGAGKKSKKELEAEKRVSEEDNYIRRAELSREFRDSKIKSYISSLNEAETEKVVSSVLNDYEGKLFETELIKSVGLNCEPAKKVLYRYIPNFEKEKEAYINSKI